MKNTIPEVINQYGDNIARKVNRKRIGCRGIIIDGDNILISYETNTQMYMTPGGGLENDETYTECCKREILEETGFITDVGEHFLIINEYYLDWLYETHYFVCTIRGTGEQRLTQNEIEHGTAPRWLPINEFINIVSKFEEYKSTDPERCGQYRRENAAILYYNSHKNKE